MWTVTKSAIKSAFCVRAVKQFKLLPVFTGSLRKLCNWSLYDLQQMIYMFIVASVNDHNNGHPVAPTQPPRYHLVAMIDKVISNA